MAVTVTPTDAGLQGHFFFQHAFFNMSLALFSFYGLWVMRKSSTSHRNSIAHNNKSSSQDKEKVASAVTEDPQSPATFSYGLDELNGRDRHPETV